MGMDVVKDKMTKDDVVKAENVIEKEIERDRRGKISLTISQLRKILTAVNTLTNRVEVYKAQHPQEMEMPDSLADEVSYLRVKVAYQAGRKREVKNFVEKADLFRRISNIKKSIAEYEKFARYMEALVAYHKFYGGRD